MKCINIHGVFFQRGLDDPQQTETGLCTMAFHENECGVILVPPVIFPKHPKRESNLCALRVNPQLFPSNFYPIK